MELKESANFSSLIFFFFLEKTVKELFWKVRRRGTSRSKHIGKCCTLLSLHGPMQDSVQGFLFKYEKRNWEKWERKWENSCISCSCSLACASVLHLLSHIQGSVGLLSLYRKKFQSGIKSQKVIKSKQTGKAGSVLHGRSVRWYLLLAGVEALIRKVWHSSVVLRM